MIYRKVNTADRLPDDAGIYFVIGRHGERFADRWSGKSWYSKGIHNIVFWLEEIELPTEEETREVSWYHEGQVTDKSFSPGTHFGLGIRWLLSKLKTK